MNAPYDGDRGRGASGDPTGPVPPTPPSPEPQGQAHHAPYSDSDTATLFLGLNSLMTQAAA